MTRAELRGPSVLALIGDMTGPALWRVLQPITALERRGYPCGWDQTRNYAVDAIAHRYDGIVLPRLAWPIGFRDVADRWFAELRRRGQFVVFECDDDLFSTAMTRRALAAGLAGGKTFEQLEADRHALRWMLDACDGVTVSTAYLADVVRQRTAKPVVVVPNALDLAWFRSVLDTARRAPPSGPVIGWAGGQRDESDLRPLADAWSRLATRYPSVRFVVAGHPSPSLLAAVPAERLDVRPWLPIERYPLNLAGLTIGCCALDDSDFNRSKSNIKALEYAAAGACVVASPTVYGQLITHGQTGYLAENAADWYYMLADLIERPACGRIMARRLLRVVERDYSLDGNLWRWPAAWSIIAESARGRVVQLA